MGKKNIYTAIRSHSTLIEVSNEKFFRELDRTGAVIEKGIAIHGLSEENVDEVDQIIPEKTATIHKEPYRKGETAYYPFEEREELINLYKMIKKLSYTPDDLDIRNLKSLSEKIAYVYRKAFFEDSQRPYKSIASKICFSLWIMCGVLNTMQGNQLLYIVNYLCALFQLDVATLTEIIIASSISKEKKEFLIESIKANGINPKNINGDVEVSLYTIFPNAEKPLEVISKFR